MIKHIFSTVAVLATSISWAYAAPAAVEPLRIIDLGTTEAAGAVYRTTAAAADAAGKIYFTNNLADEIGRFDPLTVTTGNDVEVIYDGDGGNAPFSSSSFAGITVDSASGDVYASGPGSSYSDVGLIRCVNTGGTWGKTYVVDKNTPGAAAGATFGGIVSIGANRLAISDANSHQIRFYQVNTGTNALSTVGTVSAAGPSGFWSPGLALDSVNNKFYQASGHSPSGFTGRVDRFSFNSATPTASPDTAINPVVDQNPSLSTASSFPMYYQSVAVSPDAKILCVAKNIAQNGTYDLTVKNGFALYDINANNGMLTPFAVLDGSEFPNQIQAIGSVFAYGCTFFKQNNELYLYTSFSSQAAVADPDPGKNVVYSANQVFTGFVYKITPYSSGVSDWTVY